MLRSHRPTLSVSLDDIVTGQYVGRTDGKASFPGYLDDETVPKGSLCPTFAAAALHINNARWDGATFSSYPNRTSPNPSTVGWR